MAVHLDCYRSVTDTTGPWYCELCEELSSSKGSRAPTVNFWEKPAFAVECGLCGGNAGAFRKTTDGQWVHAFCAEVELRSFTARLTFIILAFLSYLFWNIISFLCYIIVGA